MLRRTFDNYQIMLNVPVISGLVGIHSGIVRDEKEIIVKNIKKDFKFKREEIYLLKKEKGV